jgi:hypothetical protein
MNLRRGMFLEEAEVACPSFVPFRDGDVGLGGEL